MNRVTGYGLNPAEPGVAPGVSGVTSGFEGPLFTNQTSATVAWGFQRVHDGVCR
nr:hypothetical protein [Aquisalimonas sp.]